MSAKKIAAIFAVIIMLVCPLAAVMGDAEGASKKDVDPAATHISLANLDKKDLEELFGISFDEKFKSSDELGDTAKYLLCALMPGININALREIDPKSFDISGVNIQFDYVQQVTVGTEAKAQFAVSISVDKMTLTFSKTYKDAAILASDELDLIGDRKETAGMPAEMYKVKSELAATEGKADRDGLVAIVESLETEVAKQAAGQDFDRDKIMEILIGSETSGISLKDILTDLYKKYSVYADVAEFNTWMDSINIASAAADYMTDEQYANFLTNYLVAPIKEWLDGESGSEQAFIDSALDVYARQYSRTVSVFAAMQTILGTSDFGTGIIDKFGSKNFDGNGLTISGSASAKVYVLFDMKTQEVELPSEYAKAFGTDVKGYGVTESGISIYALMQTMSKTTDVIPDAEKLSSSAYSTNKGKSEMVGFMKLLMLLPINEIDVKVDSDVTMEHRGDQTQFRTEAELREKSVIGYDYNDIESIFDTSKDSGFMVNVKELELAASIRSTFVADGKQYDSNGLTLDLSPILRSLVDKIHGNVYWLYDRTAKVQVYTWFGFLAGNEQLPGSLYFERAPITFDVILNLFQSGGKTNAPFESEADAIDAIRTHGGTCSHELSDAQKGVDSIKDAIDGKQSKDNSMLILGIVVTIIVILAIIGFAMIVRSGPGAKKKQKKPQIDYEED